MSVGGFLVSGGDFGVVDGEASIWDVPVAETRRGGNVAKGFRRPC
jgi:hypothetical protein